MNDADPSSSSSPIVPCAPQTRSDGVDLRRIGNVLYILATVVAGVAAGYVFFQTSFCPNQRVSQAELYQYASAHSSGLHAWLVGIAVGWAAVPAVWSLVCARAKVEWGRFAIVATGSLIVGLAGALTAVAQQGPFCISGF